MHCVILFYVVIYVNALCWLKYKVNIEHQTMYNNDLIPDYKNRVLIFCHNHYSNIDGTKMKY